MCKLQKRLLRLKRLVNSKAPRKICLFEKDRSGHFYRIGVCQRSDWEEWGPKYRAISNLRATVSWVPSEVTDAWCGWKGVM
jgi:hypothetical protein